MSELFPLPSIKIIFINSNPSCLFDIRARTHSLLRIVFAYFLSSPTIHMKPSDVGLIQQRQESIFSVSKVGILLLFIC
jgi:hypothetical protein